jgi:hypothetical protein
MGSRLGCNDGREILILDLDQFGGFVRPFPPGGMDMWFAHDCRCGGKRNYVLTHGGPQNATNLFATYAFDIGMGAGQLGLGARSR